MALEGSSLTFDNILSLVHHYQVCIKGKHVHIGNRPSDCHLIPILILIPAISYTIISYHISISHYISSYLIWWSFYFIISHQNISAPGRRVACPALPARDPDSYHIQSYHILSQYISPYLTKIYQHLAGELPVLLSLPEILRETEGRHHLTSLARLARGLSVCLIMGKYDLPLFSSTTSHLLPGWQEIGSCLTLQISVNLSASQHDGKNFCQLFLPW